MVKRPPKWWNTILFISPFLSLIDSADVSWIETIMSLNLSIIQFKMKNILKSHCYAQGGCE